MTTQATRRLSASLILMAAGVFFGGCAIVQPEPVVEEPVARFECRTQSTDGEVFVGRSGTSMGMARSHAIRNCQAGSGIDTCRGPDTVCQENF